MNEIVCLKMCSYLIASAKSGNIEIAKDIASRQLPVELFDSFDTKSVEFEPSIHSVVFDDCLQYFLQYGKLVTDSVLLAQYEQSSELDRKQKREVSDYIKNCIHDPGVENEYRWCLDQAFENYQKNKVLQITLSSTKRLEEGSVEALSYMRSSLGELENLQVRSGFESEKATTGTEMLESLYSAITENREIVAPKAYFGWRTWDETVGGLYPEELTLLAGKPSMGKSFVLGEIVFHNAFVLKKKVVYSTNELTKKQFEMRMLSRLSNVPLEKIRKNILTDKERKLLKELLEDYIKDEYNNLVIIPPLCAYSVESIKHHTELMLDGDPDLHAIDHLTKLRAGIKGIQDWREKEYNCERLKTLAQEHKCPVLSPVHISREGAKSEVVTLEDVQYQSYIQLADNIWVLNQHKDYPSLPPVNGEFEGTAGIVIATVERARTVAVGTEKYLMTNFSCATVSEPSFQKIQELTSPTKIDKETVEKEVDELGAEYTELYEEFGE